MFDLELLCKEKNWLEEKIHFRVRETKNLDHI
jgi:hypothetical protein